MTRRTVAMAFARSQLQVVKEMMALVVEKNGNKRWIFQNLQIDVYGYFTL